MVCSPSGSSVHGISQARIQWVASSFSRDLTHPGYHPALAGRFFTTEPPGKPETRTRKVQLCGLTPGLSLGLPAGLAARLSSGLQAGAASRKTKRKRRRASSTLPSQTPLPEARTLPAGLGLQARRGPSEACGRHTATSTWPRRSSLGSSLSRGTAAARDPVPALVPAPGGESAEAATRPPC